MKNKTLVPLNSSSYDGSNKWKEKHAELQSLKEKLIEQELELTNLQFELSKFENTYNRIVGTKYLRLDELKAKCAELLHILYPNDQSVIDQVQEARKRAEESAKSLSQKDDIKSDITDDMKRLYREAAKRVHPDFARTDQERSYRTQIMAELNEAYNIGDEAWLKDIIEAWGRDEFYINGNGDDPELAILNLQIAQIKRRLSEIEKELESLHRSDMYKIKLKAENFKQRGQDLLREMAAEIEGEISEVEIELERLERLQEKAVSHV